MNVLFTTCKTVIVLPKVMKPSFVFPGADIYIYV